MDFNMNMNMNNEEDGYTGRWSTLVEEEEEIPALLTASTEDSNESHSTAGGAAPSTGDLARLVVAAMAVQAYFTQDQTTEGDEDDPVPLLDSIESRPVGGRARAAPPAGINFACIGMALASAPAQVIKAFCTQPSSGEDVVVDDEQRDSFAADVETGGAPPSGDSASGNKTNAKQAPKTNDLECIVTAIALAACAATELSQMGGDMKAWVAGVATGPLQLALFFANKKQMNRVEKKVDDLATAVDNVDKKLGTAIDNVDKKLGTAIDNVDKKLGTAIDNVDKKLGTAIDNVDKKVDDLGTAVNARIDNLEKKVDKVDKKVDDLGTAVNARIDNLEKKVNARIDNLEKKVDKVGTAVGALEEKMDKKFDKLTQLVINAIQGEAA